MKKIEIKIDADSAKAKVFKKYMEEKAAFKKAVASGKVSSFVKQSGQKFDTPISVGK